MQAAVARTTHGVTPASDAKRHARLELNLLPESERLIFRRLSVFVGAFSLEGRNRRCRGHPRE